MNLEELKRLKEKTQQQIALREGRTRYRVVVSTGTSGIAAGARAVMKTLLEEIEKHGLDDVEVCVTGEIGLEDVEPVVRIEERGGEQTTYTRLSPDSARQIVAQHLQQGRPCTPLLPADTVTGQREFRFFAKQVKVVLENCGVIDPKSLSEYVARDGYAALGQVLATMTPEQVIAEIKASGLRGRGGAGFPTGAKWELLYQAPDPQKYVVCNADEGDPGAFMNRAVLEGDPHRVIEGMAIGAYAMGASRGFIHIRAEYPVAIKRLQLAIRRAYEAGLLGQRLFETPFGFDLELRIGAGAFVCGEETAMMRSIEGRRGQPQPRPPYPAERGVWGHPTNIN
ncbi:NADH-quinone oxidoreductase subunit F, partial [bacterium]|nr:NADH-quinone oxidoreductase subunit F [bacterium]